MPETKEIQVQTRVVKDVKSINIKTFYMEDALPFLYGAGDGPNITGDELLDLNKIFTEKQNQENIQFTGNNERLIFAYPKQYEELIAIQDTNDDITPSWTLDDSPRTVNINFGDKVVEYLVYYNDADFIGTIKLSFYFEL